MVKVFINAGHGKHDAGAVNKELKLEERNVALDIAKAVCSNLNFTGIENTLYQEVNSLNEVPKKANEFKADLFVSIHLNSATTKTAKGVEVLYCEGSKQGKLLAQTIQNEITKPIAGYNFTDRKIKDDKNRHLCVLRQTKMTSCLVEMGFINNNTEANFIIGHINECAQAICTGIINYLQAIGSLKPIYTNPTSNTPEIVIVPSGKDETYNLIINNTVVLKGNKLLTIGAYLSNKYSEYLK